MSCKQAVGMFVCRCFDSLGFIVAAILLLSPSVTVAVDKYWNVSSGDWSDSSPCPWNPTPEPTSSDIVYIANGGTANVTQSSEACNNLYLGNSGTGHSGTVQMTGGTLSESWAYIGNSGIGTFTQSAGTNTVSFFLYLGYYSGSSGTYNLSDSGQLSTNYELVGLSSTGTFTHTAGTNTVSNTLYLGYSSVGSGTYNLSGSGQLSANSEAVGVSGTGTFTHSAGSNTSNTLYLGYNSGGSGTYNLSGTGQLSAQTEYIGCDKAGTGVFNHSAGTNNVTDLKLGYDSNGNTGSIGTYNLSGTGQLSAWSSEIIGESGTGIFNHSAGTNNVTKLSLGYYPNGIGTYNLSGTEQLFTAFENIGYYGKGTFNQSGGTNNVIDLKLGYSDYSSFSGFGSSGTYNQSAGINNVANLTLGSYTSSSLHGTGTYNLTGGILSLNSISGASSSLAHFNFGGGTMQASGAFTTTLPMNLTGIGGNANIDTAGYAITLSGVLSGTGGLNKLGAGTLTLSAGGNTFTGAVNLNGGLIKAAALNRLGNGTTLNFNGGGLQFDGVFDLSVRTVTFQAGGATLDTQSNNIILANAIGNGGTGGLTKLGSGKLTLNALNSYSGDTIVNGGTLVFSGGIDAGGTSFIDVQSGTAVFETTNVDKADLHITTAALAIFEVASGTHEIGSIEGSGGTQIDDGATLSVDSIYQGGLYIGSGAKLIIHGTTCEPLGDTFTPVPEPSMLVLLCVAAFGLLVSSWRWRKRAL